MAQGPGRFCKWPPLDSTFCFTGWHTFIDSDMDPTAMHFYVAFLWQFYLSWEKQLYFVEGQRNSTLHPLGSEEAAPSPWCTLVSTVETQWALATRLSYITSSDDLLWNWKQWEKASTEDYWQYCTFVDSCIKESWIRLSEVRLCESSISSRLNYQGWETEQQYCS